MSPTRNRTLVRRLVRPTAPDRVERSLAKIPDQESLVGTFVSQTGAIATVNQGKTQLLVRSSATGLVAGDGARLERRNGDLVLTGPTAPRAKVGRVTATGTLTTVEYPNGSGVTAQLQRNAAYTPAVNDLVLIEWESGGVIVGKIGAAPTNVTPDPPAPAAPKPITATFTAIDSGSYQAPWGWRTNDVWSSASNLGAWFYGSKIRDTIPDAATIQKAQIYLPLQQQLGSAPFGRHGNATKPAGVVSFAALAEIGSDRSGWVSIPTSLIDHLKSNTGGLGFNYGGYNVWRGRQSDGLSGAVRVTYK